jgi:hypothetical protein
MALAFSTNVLKESDVKGSNLVSTSPHMTEGPRTVITVDAIPEDEDRQDELNRTMRKPGDPPYDPHAKWLDPAKPKPNGQEANQGVLPNDSAKEPSGR